MILVVDFECKNFSHEEFNAGTVYQVRCAFPKANVIYMAEKQQIECVNNIINSRSSCDNIFYRPFDNEKTRWQEFDKYVGENAEQLELIIFTSIGVDFLNKMGIIIKAHTKIQFAFMQHGEVDKLSPNYSRRKSKCHRLLRKRTIENLNKNYNRDISEKETYRDGLMELSQFKNCTLIVFNTSFFQENLNECNVLKQNAKMVYLPYVFTEQPQREKNKRLSFGFCASSIGDSFDECYVITKKFCMRHPIRAMQTKILALNPGRSKFLLWKVSAYKPLTSNREDINQFYRKIDWLIIPYDQSKYLLSSSGIFFDALATNTPMITGDSKCFQMYKQYNIGFLGNKIEDISEIMVKVSSITQKQYDQYIENIILLKERMVEFNINVLREIVKP